MAAGLLAAREGRASASRAWLDRAWRLAPGDPVAGLALAATDPARARPVLEAVLKSHPADRDARLALIAASLGDGDAAAAADRLGALLSGTAPGRGIRRLADLVVRESGAAGWIGADSTGRVVGGLANSRGEPVTITLDGQRIDMAVARRAFRLPPGSPGRWLAASRGGRALLGSPIDLAALRRVEGSVRPDSDGGLSGCAWMPGDPDAAPKLWLVAGATRIALRPGGAAAVAWAPARARGFRIPPGAWPSDAAARILDEDGRDLTGSPARPIRPPRAPRKGPPRLPPQRASIDVVIAVHGGAGDLAACVASLRRGLPANTRIIVVDDASDDPALAALLAGPALGDGIIVLRLPRNLGFPAAANAGLRHSRRESGGRRRDVLLLNPDTLLPPCALARLADAAYADATTGSVTPLSHDGTIVSCEVATPPDQAMVDRLDSWCAAANGDERVEVPTGIGFCLFLRHDCLADVGMLREDAFAQGYGEENDWCRRGHDQGWRHVAASGVFVGHKGGASFGPRRALLMARNAPILARLHPGYAAAVEDFQRRDPLRPARRRLAAARWRDASQAAAGDSVILVTHGFGGGTERHVIQRVATLRGQGMRPIVLRLSPDDASHATGALAAGEAVCADLRFRIPEELAELAALLEADRPRWMEAHHFAGLPPDVLDLARSLGIPFDVAAHDYAMACPRVTFCAEGRYCGEPTDPALCDRCVARSGSRLHESLSVAELRARSARILAAARRVVAPCEDVSRRLRRHFPAIQPVVTPWERDARGPDPRLSGHHSAREPATVCVVGAIGRDKGYDILLDCAEDAARRALALRFVVVGHTIDDARLLAAGGFVTGRFDEAEAVSLVMAQGARLGFVPSVCPETWSFALSTLWRAGLPTACFALGAPAERIRASPGGGWVIPLGAPAARINDLLLECAQSPARERAA